MFVDIVNLASGTGGGLLTGLLWSPMTAAALWLGLGVAASSLALVSARAADWRGSTDPGRRTALRAPLAPGAPLAGRA